MPRLSRLSRKQVSESTGEIYDRYMRQRGNVPNMFRTIAHRPEILATMIAHFEAILNTGTLPTRLKELVIVRTSQLNACEYCLASHTAISRKLGWSSEQLENLADFESREDFSPAEKAAEAYERELKTFFPGAPEFDLQLLGLGPEGLLTASAPGVSSGHQALTVY